jgi:hypothetical protein
MGRPPNKVAAKLMDRGYSRATAFRKIAAKRERQRTLHQRLDEDIREFSPLIKPSDNWNFTNRILYDRIDDGDGHGYIPGDLYANCLFYLTKPGDLVVAPMAGSGQVQRVYDDRALWMRPAPWDLDLRMFDLTPRGRYKALIRAWDMTRGFPPVERAPDYVVMDVPYFGCCVNQYSDKPDDIANMVEVTAWTHAQALVAQGCGSVGAKLCTVIVPNYINSDTGEVVLCAEIIRDVWKAAGYGVHRVAYASKGIQAARTHRIQVLNHHAKRMRAPLSDIAEVLTFRWTASR